jgi:hypothetical protein
LEFGVDDEKKLENDQNKLRKLGQEKHDKMISKMLEELHSVSNIDRTFDYDKMELTSLAHLNSNDKYYQVAYSFI